MSYSPLGIVERNICLASLCMLRYDLGLTESGFTFYLSFNCGFPEKFLTKIDKGDWNTHSETLEENQNG